MSMPQIVNVRNAQIDADEILETAQKETGLTDFGDTWFEQPFRQIVDFINDEAALTAADVGPVQSIRGYLGDRLRLVQYLKDYPEVHNEKVSVGGIIIGLPRGGSTLTQRLISNSPQLTSTYFWEGITPLPLPGEKPGDTAPRKEIGKIAAQGMIEAWPNMKAMHPIGADAYEENTAFLARSFISMMYISIFHLPSYVSWQFRQNHVKVYEELKVWLQVLQYQDPSRRGRTWLLKTSCHLLAGGLMAALRTFPEAHAILSHRSIERVVASWCSLQYEMLRGTTVSLDKALLGPEAVELFVNGFETLLQARREFPAHRFIDVHYDDLVAQPLEQFRYIVEKMGLTVGPADDEAAAAWMAQNGRDTHPPHRYSLEDYGVTSQSVREDLKFFYDSYAVPQPRVA